MIHRTAEIVTDWKTVEFIWVSSQNYISHILFFFFFFWKNLPCQFPTLPVFHPQQQNELSKLSQQSLDGGVDVPPCGDESLQVGLTVDEAHRVELVELLLEPNLWILK